MPAAIKPDSTERTTDTRQFTGVILAGKISLLAPMLRVNEFRLLGFHERMISRRVWLAASGRKTERWLGG